MYSQQDEITIAEIFNKNVKKLMTGSELVLMARISEYLVRFLGKRLTLEGVNIFPRLLKTPYFGVLQDSGVNLDTYENAPYIEYDKSYFLNKDVSSVEFDTRTDALWVYKEHTGRNFQLMQGWSVCSSAYINLIAYLIVHRYTTGLGTQLCIDNDRNTAYEHQYSDILILKNYGNRLIDDSMVKVLETPDYNKHIWISFRMMYWQWGLMCRDYSVKEKLNAFKRKFAVGDVVLLYSQSGATKTCDVLKLQSCYPAVIRGYDDKKITLEYYPCVETKETRKRKIQNANIEKPMFSVEDIERFPVAMENFDWQDVGVEGYTFKEKKFIFSVLPYDGSFQYLNDGNSVEKVCLSTADTIYAVFEDRGVDYNKERYIRKYFSKGGKIPVYDKYKKLRMINGSKD